MEQGTGRPFWGGVLAFLSLAIPLVVTALRVSIAPQWRDDVAIVQSLGFVPIGGEGIPGAVLAQLVSLLPVGGRVLRAGLVGAIGAGICGRALFGIALSLLERSGKASRLSPTLALAASLMAVLSPTFQHEGTAAGGATLAAGLSLLVLLSRERGTTDDARTAFGLGALLGLTLAESRVAALASAVALGARALSMRSIPKPRSLAFSGLGLALSTGFCSIPLFVRPLAEHASATLGFDLSPHAAIATDVVVGTASPIVAFLSELGPLALGLAGVGLCAGIARPHTRRRIAPLAALALGSAAFVARGPSVLAASPVAALTLLGVAALAALAVLGVQTASLALVRANIPLATPASVLLVVFHFTLVFAAAESSSAIVTETTGLGAEVWTDEALGELPTGSLLIVRSPVLAFRLWASRVTRGERPDLVVVPMSLLGRGDVARRHKAEEPAHAPHKRDVMMTFRLWASRVTRGERPDLVVVPMSLLGRGDVARRLIAEEPALAPLMRDVMMTGRASEYALSTLADARPLYVELDPAWDRRLLDHLRPTPLWVGFTSHTLGRSDRGIAILDDSGRRAFRRVLSVAKSSRGGDPGTLAVLAARARDQAFILASLGDKDSARRVLGDLARVEPDPKFASKIEARLRTLGSERLAARFDGPALLETR
jgi:hypothetical protein